MKKFILILIFLRSFVFGFDNYIKANQQKYEDSYFNEVSFYPVYNEILFKADNKKYTFFGIVFQYSFPGTTRILSVYIEQNFSFDYPKTSMSINFSPMFLFACASLPALLRGSPGCGCFIFPFVFIEFNAGIGFSYIKDKFYLDWPINFNFILPLVILNKDLKGHSIKVGFNFKAHNEYDSKDFRIGYSIAF